MRNDNKKKRGGFEDIPKQEQCLHPGHRPPSHMVIPQGKQYRHICPGCGRETLMRPPQIRMMTGPAAEGPGDWIISVGGYGSFGFLGTEAEAEEMRAHKADWEGGVGRKRRADPAKPKDLEMIKAAKGR